jgi:hypothetical protein
VPIPRPIQLALLAALIGSGADGQAAPSFDVASVRPHNPNVGGAFFILRQWASENARPRRLQSDHAGL